MSEMEGAPAGIVQTGAPPPRLPPSLPATQSVSRSQRSPLADFGIDLAIAITLTFAILIVAGMLWGIVRGFELATSGVDPEGIAAHLGQPGALFQIGVSALSFGAAALVLVLWRRRPTAQERAHSRTAMRRASTWALAVGTGAMTSLLTSGLSWLAEMGGIELAPTNDAMIRALMAQSPWLLIGFAVCLAPVYEELLFRRVFYGRLLAAGRPLLGLALSAGLFAFIHEVPGVGGNPWSATLALWLVYAGMGVAFAMLYRRCGTLWAPIAAHATHNLLACLLLLNDVT